MIRLAQVEEELSSALSKNGSLEKTKARLTGEVEDLQLDLERVSLNFQTIFPLRNLRYHSLNLAKCTSDNLTRIR